MACTIQAQALLSPRYGNFTREDSNKNSPVLEELRAVYAICWQRDGEVIKAAAAHGTHDFLKRSKSFNFVEGQGYVGRLFDGKVGDVALIEDVLSEDPRAFHRKTDAVISGVDSIVFVRVRSAILELGFEEKQAATAASDAMRGNHFLIQSRLDEFARAELDNQTDCSPVQVLNAAKPFLRGRSNGSSTTCAGSSRDTTPSSLGDRRRERLVWSDASDSASPCRTRSPSPETPVQENMVYPTRGSVGHPFCCGAPCKFRSRKRGCQQGDACDHCHLCDFSRALHKEKKDVPYMGMDTMFCAQPCAA